MLEDGIGQQVFSAKGEVSNPNPRHTVLLELQAQHLERLVLAGHVSLDRLDEFRLEAFLWACLGFCLRMPQREKVQVLEDGIGQQVFSAKGEVSNPNPKHTVLLELQAEHLERLVLAGHVSLDCLDEIRLGEFLDKTYVVTAEYTVRLTREVRERSRTGAADIVNQDPPTLFFKDDSHVWQAAGYRTGDILVEEF